MSHNVPQSYIAFIMANCRFLGFGLLATALSGFGQTFYVGLFNPDLRDAFSLGHAQLGGLYSAATLASALILTWSGRLLDRYDMRVYAAATAALLALGCAALAVSRNWLMLAAAMLLLRLAGQGMMVHMGLTAMARYFGHHRGKALGVAALGFPLSQAVMPPLAVAGVSLAGWRSVWALGAALLLAVFLPLLLWLLRGHHHRSRALADRLAQSQAVDRAEAWTVAEMLRDRRFYLLLPAAVAAPLVITALLFHQVPMAASKGWSREWVGLAMLGFSLGDAAGMLTAGPLVDRFGGRRLLAAFLVPLALSCLTLALATQPWAAPLHLALAGLAIGLCGTAVGAMWAELYGVTHLGAIRALTQAIMVVATAAAPLGGGWLLDAGFGPYGVATMSGAYTIAAALLAVLAPAESGRPLPGNGHRQHRG